MTDNMLEVSKDRETLLFQLTPPQTNGSSIGVTKGCYCFVIDISGSMNAAAEVTTDDGDKVSHGWSQLDISKHATNTVVSSLEEGDYVAVITYSDAAKVLLDWTQCDASGKAHAMHTIDSMRPERSTNLMAGIVSGLDMMKKVPQPDATLDEFGLNLIICTDGMPSPQWHPARGRDGYAPLVQMLLKKLTASRGPAARTAVTTIGLGSQLDSDLLVGFSDFFLHIPDPGSVGPFMVNMLAAQRSTARLQARRAVANQASLLLSPASAVKATPGYAGAWRGETKGPDGEPALRLPLGALLYDQVRHVVVETNGEAAVSATLLLHDAPVATASSAGAAEASEGRKELIEAERLRLRCVDAIDASAKEGDASTVSEWVEAAAASAVAALPPVAALIATVREEVLLGLQPESWRKWGQHYVRTFPLMLRAERRSNFRDKALQHFGRDAAGNEALFEDQSNKAEMTFATLKAPEPSLLAPRAAVGVPVAAGANAPAGGATDAPRAAPPMSVLPEEFMRGGGCFAPEGLVCVLDGAGGPGMRRIDAVRAGDQLATADGGTARVRCVVATQCEGGRALLVQLPGGGPALTPWHPVRDGRTAGRWRFPTLLGAQECRACPHVYNLVLDRCHELLVDGVPCVTLGHGLKGDVVEHAYWGTQAVLADLSRQPGWGQGFVLLRPNELRAAAPPPAPGDAACATVPTAA